MKEITLPKIFEPFYCNDLVRLGKQNDGGYLVNIEDVKKTSRLISFGVGDDTSFEEDFIKVNSCVVDAYDGTIEQIPPFFQHDNYTLHHSNIGHGIDKKRLCDVLSAPDENLFLKCDIEGAEYQILDELIVHSSKFCGMALEFHDIYEYPLFNLLSNFISKIDQKLIHIHLNNWSYLETPTGYLPGCVELSFSSSKNISLSPVILPHDLDSPNAPMRDEFRILF